MSLVPGFLIGLVFRLVGGVNVMGIPPILKYPYFDYATGTQLFPFRTLSMAICFVTLILVSNIANYLFLKVKISDKYDILRVYSNTHENHSPDHVEDNGKRKLELITEESTWAN